MNTDGPAEMITFRNAKFTRRSHETTNIVECQAKTFGEARAAMPGIDWVDKGGPVSGHLTQLFRVGDVRVFGYL